MLLTLASIIFLESESLETRDHILLSDLRLPFSSPPTTSRVTVEVFEPASTRVLLGTSQSQSQSHIATDGHSISKFWCRAPSGAHDQIFCYILTVMVLFSGAPSLTKGRSVFCICCWPSPAYSFSGPSYLRLVAIFYCLRSETSLFVTSYDSQGHGGGIRNRLQTGTEYFKVKVKVKVMLRLTVQSASLSWNKAPIWDLRIGTRQSHIAIDGQSISKPWCRAPSGAHDQIFITI
jgi:hypothetical protein